MKGWWAMTNFNLELKSIKEYPGYYCNRKGDIYSTKKHIRNPDGSLHKMTPTLNGAGYLHVTLRKEGKKYSRVVHRLIAKTWMPNPESKRTINHIDGNKENNHVDNLEWATDSENVRHSWTTGLSYKETKAVNQYDKEFNLIATFTSIKKAAEKTNSNRGSITRNAKGFLKTHNGFIWRYADV